MSERKVNDRRQWKAQTFDYDYYFTGTPGRQCTVCLTDKQRELLLGLTEPLAWSTRWWSSIGTVIDGDVTEAFRDDLRRRIIMACCGDEMPIQFRYGSDGVLERSDDGGVTFFDSPEYDYRNTSTRWPNPNDLGIVTTKCTAADGVIVTFREQINEQITADMTYTAIAAAIVAALLLFVSAGTTALLTVQITALAVAIFRAGVSAWQAAFTTEVWDGFRCLVFDAMDSDSSISAAGVETLKSAIATKFTGIVVPTLQGYVNTAGSVGLTNMMRSGVGNPAANCDYCTSSCNLDDWSIITYESNPVGIELSRGTNYVIVEGIVVGGFPGTWTVAALKSTGNDICCKILDIEMLSGDGSDLHFLHVECGNARWPDSTTVNFAGLPEPTSSNTVMIQKRSGSAFTAKITFG